MEKLSNWILLVFTAFLGTYGYVLFRKLIPGFFKRTGNDNNTRRDSGPDRSGSIEPKITSPEIIRQREENTRSEQSASDIKSELDLGFGRLEALLRKAREEGKITNDRNNDSSGDNG